MNNHNHNLDSTEQQKFTFEIAYFQKNWSEFCMQSMRINI